jgi:hypothetical protein
MATIIKGYGYVEREGFLRRTNKMEEDLTLLSIINPVLWLGGVWGEIGSPLYVYF